jgi:hypothetical protein
MKRIFTVAAVIFVLATSFAVAPAGTSPSAGDTGALLAQGNADFIAMYKQYFKNMLDRKYVEVWNSTTLGSRRLIARLIAEKTNGKATEQQVMNMLDTDKNQVRSLYFDEFVKQADVKKIYETGIFALKSASADMVIATITLDQNPKDFKILKENGIFKIDFFNNLFE